MWLAPKPNGSHRVNILRKCTILVESVLQNGDWTNFGPAGGNHTPIDPQSVTKPMVSCLQSLALPVPHGAVKIGACRLGGRRFKFRMNPFLMVQWRLAPVASESADSNSGRTRSSSCSEDWRLSPRRSQVQIPVEPIPHGAVKIGRLSPLRWQVQILVEPVPHGAVKIGACRLRGRRFKFRTNPFLMVQWRLAPVASESAGSNSGRTRSSSCSEDWRLSPRRSQVQILVEPIPHGAVKIGACRLWGRRFKFRSNPFLMVQWRLAPVASEVAGSNSGRTRSSCDRVSDSFL
jgi:hypothetical protein